MFGDFVFVVAFGFTDIIAAYSAVFLTSVAPLGGGTSFERSFLFDTGSDVRATSFPVLGSSELSC